MKTLFHGMTKKFLPKRFRLKVYEFGQNFFGEERKLSAAFIGKLFFYDVVTFQLQVFAFFFLVLSLGLAIPFWYLYVYLPLLAIVLGLPISVFGVGLREGSTVFLLSLVSINLESALAFSLLAFLWSIVTALPGFVFLYMPSSKNPSNNPLSSRDCQISSETKKDDEGVYGNIRRGGVMKSQPKFGNRSRIWGYLTGSKKQS